MFEQFENLDEKLLDLEVKLADPGTLADQKEYGRIAKEHAHITKLHELYEQFKKINKELAESRELLKFEEDEDMQEMIRQEIEDLAEKSHRVEQEFTLMLLPRDPNDDKNIILEIRAGTGGDESALFVNDLFRMYSKYAEMQGWKVEILSSSPTGIGGLKEIIALLSGDKVYSRLKYESGVHRVQRVPETETQGRIHTSAVTVAVLPEVE